MRNGNRSTVGKFALVGVANTLAGLAVIYLCKALFQINDVAANVVGYSVGLLLSFALNRSWTFRFRGAMGSTFMRFVLVILVGYALNLVTVLFALDILRMNGYLAQALGVPLYAVSTYLGCRYFVFVQREEAGVAR